MSTLPRVKGAGPIQREFHFELIAEAVVKLPQEFQHKIFTVN